MEHPIQDIVEDSCHHEALNLVEIREESLNKLSIIIKNTHENEKNTLKTSLDNLNKRLENYSPALSTPSVAFTELQSEFEKLKSENLSDLESRINSTKKLQDLKTVREIVKNKRKHVIFSPPPKRRSQLLSPKSHIRSSKKLKL